MSAGDVLDLFAFGPSPTRKSRADQRAEVLDALRAAGPSGIRSTDLMDRTSLKAQSRIGELRADGHVIETEYDRDGIARYVYVRQGAPRPRPTAALKIKMWVDDEGRIEVEAEPYADTGDPGLTEALAEHLTERAREYLAPEVRYSEDHDSEPENEDDEDDGWPWG